MTAPINDIKTLIKVLENSFLHSTDNINYGDILKKVESRNSVRYIVGDIVSVKRGMSKPPYCLNNSLSCCDSLLDGYMNECIAKCFENSEETTEKCFAEAYVNIREHENQNTIREKIVEIANKHGLDVKVTAGSIEWKLTEFKHDFNVFKQFEYGTNGYNKFLPICKSEAAELLNIGYYPFDFPNVRGICNVFSEVRSDQEKKRQEEEKIKKELNKRQEERRAFKIKTTIGIIGVVGFIALFIWLLSFCEGDDGTIGNWFMALVCLLALMKGGKR